MAKNIDFMGATFPDVPSIRLPQHEGGLVSFDDTTDATATAEDIAQGKTAYVNGQKVTGTASGGSAIEALSVTENGVYTASGDVDGYSPVTVNVSGGGGVTPAPPKQINFIDYDGTILYSYTSEEWESVTSLPDNPSHDGLVAQGWNWTKAQIDAQLADMPEGPVWVGQMYVTESGDTEIDVEFVDSARLSPYLACAPNGTVEIDWGDGSTHSIVTGTSLTTRKDTQHTYASTGNYTIKIHVVSGSFAFHGTTAYAVLHKGHYTANANRVYSNCVKAVRIGNNANIGQCAFYYCSSLSSVTIPSGVTSIGATAFGCCYSLAFVTIPSGVTSIGTSAFQNCYSLALVTIPSGVTSIGNQMFNTCYAFVFVTIPSGVTSIGNSVFTNCYSLSSVTIPSGVTSIENHTFNSCFGIAEYHFKPTTPPTLGGTNVFANIQSDCIIYVPAESLEAYKTAQYWSTHASKMRGE